MKTYSSIPFAKKVDAVKRAKFLRENGSIIIAINKTTDGRYVVRHTINKHFE